MDFRVTDTKHRKAFQGPTTKRSSKQWSIGGKTIYHKKNGKPRCPLSEKKTALRLKRQTTTRVKAIRRLPLSSPLFSPLSSFSDNDETVHLSENVHEDGSDFDAEEYVQWLLRFGVDWV